MEERDRTRDSNRASAGDSNKDARSTSRFVRIQSGPVSLAGNLYLPAQAEGLVVFIHGSGSSRNSPRNQQVAGRLNQLGLGTLLFDLLTYEEEQVDMHTRHLRFDIGLLARRVMGAVDWLNQNPLTRALPLGFFGASTGAAAALIAAAERPELIRALVSRGGRPDLALSTLSRVQAPTLFIVGELDRSVLDLNTHAQSLLPQSVPHRLDVIPGATHLFDDPGVLEQVTTLAAGWFSRYLVSQARAS